MIGFIILHYVVEEETKKCVDSILKLKGDKRVIIVDNCSPNDSFDELKRYYKDKKNVYVIKNVTNNGFAKGNNFGYNFAKKNINNLKFLVLMNNDMEILQEDFIEKINQIYNKDHFYLLGPDIYSTSAKIHQNPENKSVITIERIDEKIRELKGIKKYKLVVKSILKKVPYLDKYVQNRKARKNNNLEYTTKKVNKMLHASCVIFSDLFISKEENAFLPITTFFCEDLILHYYCNQKKYLRIYSPLLKVYHHEDVSTNATFKSYVSKSEFKNKCMIESLEAFKRYIIDTEEKEK